MWAITDNRIINRMVATIQSRLVLNDAICSDGSVKGELRLNQRPVVKYVSCKAHALLESLISCKLCETDRKRMHGFRVYARIVKVCRKYYIQYITMP